MNNNIAGVLKSAFKSSYFNLDKAIGYNEPCRKEISDSCNIKSGGLYRVESISSYIYVDTNENVVIDFYKSNTYESIRGIVITLNKCKNLFLINYTNTRIAVNIELKSLDYVGETNIEIYSPYSEVEVYSEYGNWSTVNFNIISHCLEIEDRMASVVNLDRTFNIKTDYMKLMNLYHESIRYFKAIVNVNCTTDKEIDDRFNIIAKDIKVANNLLLNGIKAKHLLQGEEKFNKLFDYCNALGTSVLDYLESMIIKEANEKLDSRKFPFIPKLDGEEFISYSDLRYEVAEEDKHITNDYNIASILQYIKCNNTVSNSNTNGILEDIYYTKKCESIISKDKPQYVIISSNRWLSAWVEVDDPKNTTSIYYLIGAVDRGIVIDINFGDFAFINTLSVIGKYFSNIPVVHTGMVRVKCISNIPRGLNSLISNLCAIETNCLKVTGRELNISDKDGIHTYKIDAYDNIVLDK